MLSIYFNKQKHIKLSEEEFLLFRDKDDYKIILDKLKQYTLQALENNNSEIVYENIEFYTKFCEYKDVEYLMYMIESKNTEYAKKIIEGFAKRLERELKNKKVDDNSLDVALEKWNTVYKLPKKVFDNITKKDCDKSWEELAETIMRVSRDILVIYLIMYSIVMMNLNI